MPDNSMPQAASPESLPPLPPDCQKSSIPTGNIRHKVLLHRLGSAMDTDGTPQSTALLRGGQEALARGAWEEARSAFEDVLGQRNPARFSSGVADRSAETAEVLFGLGNALWWLGEIREAVRCWEQAYAAFRPIDPVQATNVALQLGFVYQANLGNDAAAAG